MGSKISTGSWRSEPGSPVALLVPIFHPHFRSPPHCHSLKVLLVEAMGTSTRTHSLKALIISCLNSCSSPLTSLLAVSHSSKCISPIASRITIQKPDMVLLGGLACLPGLVSPHSLLPSVLQTTKYSFSFTHLVSSLWSNLSTPLYMVALITSSMTPFLIPRPTNTASYLTNAA